MNDNTQAILDACRSEILLEAEVRELSEKVAVLQRSTLSEDDLKHLGTSLLNSLSNVLEESLQASLQPLMARIIALETENQALKTAIATTRKDQEDWTTKLRDGLQTILPNFESRLQWLEKQLSK